MEHLVASHKHRLAAASRKIMHTMGRRTWGKNIQHLIAIFARKKWRRKAIGKLGKKWEKNGEKNLEKKLRKKYGKKSRKKITKKVPAKL